MFLRMDKYHNIPFCEMSQDAFYTYARVEDLLKIKTKHMRIRTMGILSSSNGGFHLKDNHRNVKMRLESFEQAKLLNVGRNTDMEINLPLYKSEASIQVSMAFLKVPFKSNAMPQAVQIFGTLQWKNKPVIFANILQVLNVPVAIKLNDAITSIALDHLVNYENENQEVCNKTDFSDSLP